MKIKDILGMNEISLEMISELKKLCDKMVIDPILLSDGKLYYEILKEDQ